MIDSEKYSPPPAAIISLSKWIGQVGITSCTAWRWRKMGWLKTVNITGWQYLTRESLEEFHRRAVAGEFAQEHKAPKKKSTRP
jgi:hypothetical protein